MFKVLAFSNSLRVRVHVITASRQPGAILVETVNS